MRPMLSQRRIRMPVASLALVLSSMLIGAPLAMGAGGGGGGGGGGASVAAVQEEWARNHRVSATARPI